MWVSLRAGKRLHQKYDGRGRAGADEAGRAADQRLPWYRGGYSGAMRCAGE